MSVFVLSWKKCPRISNFLVLLWTVAAKRYVLFNNVMLLTRNISKYFAEKGNFCNLLLGLTWFESPSRDRQLFKHSCPLNFPCLWKLFSFKLKLYSILPIFYRIHVLGSSLSSHTCCCWCACIKSEHVRHANVLSSLRWRRIFANFIVYIFAL